MYQPRNILKDNIQIILLTTIYIERICMLLFLLFIMLLSLNYNNIHTQTIQFLIQRKVCIP